MNQTMVSSKLFDSMFIWVVVKYFKNLEFLNFKISQFDQDESDYGRKLSLAHKYLYSPRKAPFLAPKSAGELPKLALPAPQRI